MVGPGAAVEARGSRGFAEGLAGAGCEVRDHVVVGKVLGMLNPCEPTLDDPAVEVPAKATLDMARQPEAVESEATTSGSPARDRLSEWPPTGASSSNGGSICPTGSAHS